MKKTKQLSTLLTLAVLFSVGCTKSQIHKDWDKEINQVIKKSEEDAKKNQKILDDLQASMSKGGQPGSIILTGVAVVDNDKVDSRITLSQEAGLDRSGSATTLASDVKKLNTLSSEDQEKAQAGVKKLEDERSYINLGCELAESDIAGLTEKEAKTELAKDATLLTASRIFVCGELKASNALLSLTASEVMLKDGSIISEKNLSPISINTGTLILVGKNKITTLGENESGYLLSAAFINIKVSKEIYGDGELAITSKGGNNIAPQKKE